MLGQFDRCKFRRVQVSPFRVIPKSEPGVEVDCEFVIESVNDGVDSGQCSPSYITVDVIARKVVCEYGRGATMAKFDIKSAYRNVPVHPDDRRLQGLVWDKMLYVDATLPFGLRSAPKIFTAVADPLEWIIKSKGVEWLAHYLDNYVFLGPHGSLNARRIWRHP